MPRYAAIDIGSNSIRMLAADVDSEGKATTLAEDRQVTRLGESVFRAGVISQEAMTFVCQQLERMSAAYRQFDVLASRVVATAAVRDANNQAEFLERANEAAGARVEIISGQEEARLIQLGVARSWPHPNQRTLIIDIGGGSAEIIVSDNDRFSIGFSRPLGAVRLSSVFLRKDPPKPVEILQLNEFIEEKLAPAVRKLGKQTFHRAIGTSASASAVVSAVNRIPRARREDADRRRATLPQIEKLYQSLQTKDLVERRKIPGIGPRRAEIILPGAAVLVHVLRHFHLPALYYSSAGVRDGIVFDLAARRAGRERTRLSSEQRRTVEHYSQRFVVDAKHARKVAAFATTLFEELAPLHKLSPDRGRLLEAAAYLRDVGHIVNDSAHHKHSHYIVANSDLAGFTDAERQLIALLCRYHRKTMPLTRHPEFQRLNFDQKRELLLLIPLLRIADALDRSREQRIEAIQLNLKSGGVVLAFNERLDASLEQWAVERAAADFNLQYARTLEVSRGVRL